MKQLDERLCNRTDTRGSCGEHWLRQPEISQERLVHKLKAPQIHFRLMSPFHTRFPTSSALAF